jgi:hypothetical protein
MSKFRAAIFSALVLYLTTRISTLVDIILTDAVISLFSFGPAFGQTHTWPWSPLRRRSSG